MAREPYNPVPGVSPEVGSPSDYIQTNANPNQFGAQVGEALERSGQQTEQNAQRTFDTAKQFIEMQNATDALNATTGASKELGDAEVNFRSLKGNNAVAGYKNFQDQVAQIGTKYASSLGSPSAQLAFKRDFAGLSNRSLANAGIHLGEQADAAHVNALQSSIKEEQANIVRYTMTGQEPDWNGLVNKTLMLAQHQGLDQDSANAMVQKTAGQAMHDAVVARIAQGDTPGAAKMLGSALKMNAPDSDLPLLDAGHQAQLSQMIQQKQMLDENKALTAQMRQMAFDQKVKSEAAEKAGNQIVSQMILDPTKVSPEQIANDPNLSFDQKIHLNTVLQGELTKGKGNLLTSTYGNGFTPALQRVLAAPNDPNRISDPAEIWRMAAEKGDISPSGISALNELITQAKTPDGEAANTMMRQFLTNAKGQITGTDEGLHLKDPKGDDLYLRFLAQAMPSYSAGLKAGKTPAQLLNPDSQDYVGKSIPSFKRDPKQWASDMLQDGDQAAAPGAPAAPIDLKSEAGIVAAYKAGKLDRNAAAQALIQGGFASPNAPQVPISQ